MCQSSVAVARPQYTIQQILLDHFDSYLKSPDRSLYLEEHHYKAVNEIRACRTYKLGVHYFSCTSCGETVVLARSCGHRFCNRCGMADTHRWAEKMLGRLLNIKHHHVVFTLPQPLRHIAKRNKRLIYNLLFQSSSKVIKTWFAKKHGLKCGIVSVLHTNGSDLKYHPHIHMIVSGGGFREGELKELEKDYLCNAFFLGRQFKRAFIKGLLALYDRGGLEVDKRISNSQDLLVRVNGLRVERRHWVVNIEKSLEGVDRLIRYVGRYTKRSCISERRILEVKDGRVKLSYKDYKNSQKGEKPKEGVLGLGIVPFLDRLLQHVMLPGFKVVRYYGIYATSEISKLPAEHLLAKGDSILDKVDLELDDESFRPIVRGDLSSDPTEIGYCLA